MCIILISFGDELLKGERLNTHSATLCRILRNKGLCLDAILTLPDQETPETEEILKSILQKYSLVICTGGLGPTEDDRTRALFAKLYQIPLILDEAYEAHIRRTFGPTYPAQTVSCIPQGSILLKNSIGTASGFILSQQAPFFSTCVIALPGPSDEMKSMLEAHSAFLPQAQNPLFFERFFVFNQGEHTVTSLLDIVIELYPQVSYGIYPSYGYVEIAASSKDSKALALFKQHLLQHVHLCISIGSTPRSFIDFLCHQLMEKQLSLACAESCTGGAISALITSVPGASTFFQGSAIVYSDQSKIHFLHIDKKMISSYTSVSEEVGEALARACQKEFLANLGLSIVGYLGPTGGDLQVPCGTIFITLVRADQVYKKKLCIRGSRDDVQKKAALWALSFLAEKIIF